MPRPLAMYHMKYLESLYHRVFSVADHLYVILPYLMAVLISEYFVDWIKHAFITKFNDIPVEVSKFYYSPVKLPQNY